MTKSLSRITVGLAVLAFVVSLAAGDEEEYEMAAFYHFDEGKGTFVIDSSNNEYEGKLIGGTRVEGKKGNGIYLDGEEAYVELPGAILGKAPQSGIIEIWIKPHPEQSKRLKLKRLPL